MNYTLKYASISYPSRAWNYIKEGNSGYFFRFNGKESDSETYGDGNALDFGARIYDPRLGRWMAKDPKFQAYPFLSPFVAFANIPLSFVDPGGETLIIGGNLKTSQVDVFSFVPEVYRSKIKIVPRIVGYSEPSTITEDYLKTGQNEPVISVETVEIVFEITKEEAYKSNDPGVIALYEMVNSPKVYYYGAQNRVSVTDENNYPMMFRISDKNDGVIAAQKTPRAFINGTYPGFIPEEGIDGLRVIAEGTWKNNDGSPKSRESMVFHELYEMYEEGENNEFYDQYNANGELISSATGMFNGVGCVLRSNGSHGLSKKAENSLPEGDKRRSSSPGEGSEYQSK